MQHYYTYPLTVFFSLSLFTLSAALGLKNDLQCVNEERFGQYLNTCTLKLTKVKHQSMQSCCSAFGAALKKQGVLPIFYNIKIRIYGVQIENRVSKVTP